MIIALNSGTTASIEQIGGKSLGLIRLMAAGLRVPEAWAIPASISLDGDLRKTLLENELPAWWDSAPKGQLWAVRSSAVAEDLADASFAGVYETKLGLDSLASITAAIKKCWSALASDRAEAYRTKIGVDAVGGIALIIQRMISPKASGVMLTADPLRPLEQRIVIDAAWGLGEAVVSGATDPDHFVLNRNTHTQIARRLGEKAIEIIYDGGLQTREVDLDRRKLACLTEANLRDLAQVADCVSRYIGPQRDLEWAIANDTVYVLQDRPIVGLPSPQTKVIYSRKWGDEFQGEYFKPLTQDALQRWVDNGTVAFARLLNPSFKTSSAVRVYNGYCYLSGEFLAEAIKGIPPSARDSLISTFPPDYRERIGTIPLDIKTFLLSLSAPLRADGCGGIRSNLVALEKHCAQIGSNVAEKLRRDYSKLSNEQLKADYSEVDELVAQHYRIISWGLGLYNGGLHSLLPRLLQKWCGDESGELYEAMIGGLHGTHTSQVNHEVWELGQLARADANLANILRAKIELTDIDQIRAAHPAPAFWAAFDRLIDKHGHRSAAARDIASPRWREQPEVVLSLIAAHVRAATPPPSPSMAEQRADLHREAAERIAFERAGILKRSVLKWVIRYTQKYTVYRENQRYYLDLLGTQVRNIAVERGRRLVAQGILKHESDVFYLRDQEFVALTDGQPAPADLHERIAERHAHYLRYRDERPVTYLYDDVEVEGAAVDEESADIGTDGPRGIGLCRGTARGTTIVVRSLAELANVKTGDILVVGAIDPGWTSVFPIIGGLVTEIGGVLSHGAILAREYGIPTISSVKGATTLLATGTIVSIDGSTGAFTIESVSTKEDVPNVISNVVPNVVSDAIPTVAEAYAPIPV